MAAEGSCVLDSIESYLVSKYDAKIVWAIIQDTNQREKADREVVQLRPGCFLDQQTIDILEASITVLKIPLDDLMEELGRFYVNCYIRQSRDYDDFLRKQKSVNSTFWKWLATIRAAHHHMLSAKASHPDIGVIFFPEISVLSADVPDKRSKEKDLTNISAEVTIKMKVEVTSGMSLSYFALGMLKEICESQYEMILKVERLAVLAHEGIEMTEWRIAESGKYKVSELPAVLLEPTAILRQKFRDAGRMQRNLQGDESDKAASDLKAAAERVARFTRATAISFGATPAFSGYDTPAEQILREEYEKIEILIVDDSANNRKQMSRFLTSNGICEKPVEATDGVEALNYIKLGRPGSKKIEVILMDDSMPQMDGPTATKKIRASGFQGIIIGVTSTLTSEHVDYLKGVGMDAVIGKPLEDPAFFLGIMRRVNMASELPGAAVSQVVEEKGTATKDVSPAEPISNSQSRENLAAAVLQQEQQAKAAAAATQSTSQQQQAQQQAQQQQQQPRQEQPVAPVPAPAPAPSQQHIQQPPPAPPAVQQPPPQQTRAAAPPPPQQQQQQPPPQQQQYYQEADYYHQGQAYEKTDIVMQPEHVHGVPPPQPMRGVPGEVKPSGGFTLRRILLAPFTLAAMCCSQGMAMKVVDRSLPLGSDSRNSMSMQLGLETRTSSGGRDRLLLCSQQPLLLHPSSSFPMPTSYYYQECNRLFVNDDFLIPSHPSELVISVLPAAGCYQAWAAATISNPIMMAQQDEEEESSSYQQHCRCSLCRR